MAERIPVGDILILRDGFRNIAEDSEKLLAKRKQARTLMQLLDEILAHRESEAAFFASLPTVKEAQQ